MKKIIPMSVLAILTISFWSIFLISCFVAITIGLVNGNVNSIVSYIVCICILFVAEIFISLITLTYTIIIKKDSIIMWGAGKRKKDINSDQYYCEVKFDEIIFINIVPSKNDSLNRKIVGPNSIVVKEYLEFVVNSGFKRFNIFYFSKKQMRKILTIVVDKMKSLGNENYKNINIDELIEKQWNTYQEYKRKYLKKK